MRIRKAKLPKKILETINLYRDKKPAEIKKIKARWAFGVNRKRVFRPSQGCCVFFVELKKLVGAADFGEMMFAPLNPRELFSGIDERDFRVAQVLAHWDKGGYIDPPEICLNRLGHVTFGDGRHRTIAAFHLGEKKIPVRVHRSLIKKVSTAINLMRPRRVEGLV